MCCCCVQGRILAFFSKNRTNRSDSANRIKKSTKVIPNQDITYKEFFMNPEIDEGTLL